MSRRVRTFADDEIKELVPGDDDWSRQRNEITILESIFPDEFKMESIRPPPHVGYLKVPITPPYDSVNIEFEARTVTGNTKFHSCAVKYLAFDLYFSFTTDYPSTTIPNFILNCHWLPDESMMRIRRQFEIIWERSKYEILYSWAAFIQQDLFKFLKLSDHIKVLYPTLLADNEDLTKRDLSIDDALIVETKEVAYKRYIKNPVAFNNKSKRTEDVKPGSSSGNTEQISKSCDMAVASGSKQNQNNKKKNGKKNVVNLEWIEINNKMKYVCKDNRGDVRYKCETEKEKEEKSNSERIVEVPSQKYIVSLDGVRQYDPLIFDKNGKSKKPIKCVTDNEIYNTLRSEKRYGKSFGIISSIDTHISLKIDEIEAYNFSKFNGQSYQCIICYSNEMGEQCVLFNPCCHTFCKPCVKEYVIASISTNTVYDLKCPMMNCRCVIRDSLIKEVVDVETFTRFKQLKVKYVLENNKDLTCCPRDFCQNVAFVQKDGDSEMGHCPQCQFYFCLSCRKVYHGKASCDIKSAERERILYEYDTGSTDIKLSLEKRYSKRQLKEWKEEMLTNQWIQEKSSKCPNCSALIEKSHGCNKMKCAKCLAPFCWLCNAILDKQNPYKHFNDPNSACTNKLYFGTEMENPAVDDDIDNFLQVPFDEEMYIVQQLMFMNGQ